MSKTRKMAFLRQSSPINENENDPEELVPEGDVPVEEDVIQKGVVRIDDDGANLRMIDNGNDLTNRFTYKVNALMGVFDPKDGEMDNENETGNILNAMLQFPVTYSFNVVGRTSGDEVKKDVFVEQVKAAVTSISGPDQDLNLIITPRGKSFTKVSVQANVESAAMIANIYKEFEQLEMSVMQF
jgi:putative lipoic acid-binding regulatory protein